MAGFDAVPLGYEEPGYEVSKHAYVTLAIIAVNVIVYLFTTASNMFLNIDPYWVNVAGFIPALALADPAGSWYRFFTSMFLHAGILHIFFNMYFLYIFGRAVEKTIGSLRYLVLYIVGGLFASIFHTLFTILQGPAALSIPAIGASGAISAVLGAYFVLYPGTRLTACFWLPFPFCFTLSAAAFLLLWFAFQIIWGYARLGASVAVFAHAGGFIAGIALLPLLVSRARMAMLRARELFRRLFEYYNIVYRPSYIYGGEFASFKPTGVRGFARYLYLSLLLLVLVGGVYSYMAVYGSNLWLHCAHLHVVERYSVSFYTPRSISGDVVLATGSRGVYPEVFQLMPSDLTVFFNRLYYSGLLYNPRYAGRIVTLTSTVLHAGIPVCGRVYTVDVYVDRFKGVYNPSGLLVEGSGLIRSVVIQVYYPFCTVRINPSFTVSYDFRFRVYSEASLVGSLAPYFMLVIAACAGSLYAILRRPDLTITP